MASAVQAAIREALQHGRVCGDEPVRVVERHGHAPPQYPMLDDEDEWDDDDGDEDDSVR